MNFIHNDVVEKVLTMADCIDALEGAFRQISSGRAIHRPRLDMYVPCELEDGYYRWGTMEGANDGIFAIRMKSDSAGPDKNQIKREPHATTEREGGMEVYGVVTSDAAITKGGRIR